MDINTKLEQTKLELTDTDNQIKLLKAKRDTLQKVYDDLLREYTAENSNNIGWLIQNPEYPDYYKNLCNLLQKSMVKVGFVPVTFWKAVVSFAKFLVWCCQLLVLSVP